MGKTAIEWCDMTWNPLAGCQIVSAACANCYAMQVGHNLEHVKKQEKYQGLTYESKAGRKLWTGKVRFWEPAMKRVRPPRRIIDNPDGTVTFIGQQPKLIFVNSMSDLWHEDVQIDWLKRIFDRMNECEQHSFLLLTKRPEIMLERERHVTWTPNIWQGVTTEDVATANERLPLLDRCGAEVKFISAEPLLEDIAPVVAEHSKWLSWVIAGGESGTRQQVRRMEPQWARNLRDLCAAHQKPFFFKQWGNYSETGVWRGRFPKSEGIDGYLWHQWPQMSIDPPVRITP